MPELAMLPNHAYNFRLALELPEQKRIRSMSVDLYLIGAGVSFPEHLTMQTLDIMEACIKICSNLPQTELDKLPEQLRMKCLSLWSLYHEHRDRSANYDDVAQAVIERISQGGPVAWLTPGHPLIFDSVSQSLLDASRVHGWKTSVIPAISCIDTILAQLGFDPANGLVIYEATSLVEHKLPLLPALATLLLQPSAFGSSLTLYSTKWTPDLSPLSLHLLQFYPDDHRCAFVRSFSPWAGSDQISWWKLCDFALVPFEAIAGSTLFVPALASRSEVNG